VDGIHNYKLIRYNTTNYGEILLELVAFVTREWGDIDEGPFHLSGFSGGAQFAHRFWYLHPEQVASLAIAAPGACTLLDRTLPWPRGVKDEHVDIDRLEQTSVTVVVGDRDVGDGQSRIQVAHSLQRSMHDSGLHVGEVVMVKGAGHEESDLQVTLEQWFQKSMGLGDV